MSTPNINCILQAIAVVTDQNSPNFPPIATLDFQNPTLPIAGVAGGTDSFFDPYFQASVAGTSVPFPVVGGVTKAFGLFVLNKSTAGTLAVNYTPFGGVLASIIVGPRGLVIIFDPSEAGSGIASATLAGIGATVPASVLVVT